ncbi:MAG: ABC transporter substrate-binding protein [Thermomicrobiales bacterium]
MAGRPETGRYRACLRRRFRRPGAHRQGDLDIVTIEPPQVPRSRRTRIFSAALVSYPSASTYNLAMNLAQEPFNDPKVREAFAYAMDREMLCTDLRAGDRTPALS